ncbi:heme lyase NrfEFG subunit NrfE [Conservatibacter flavescens]|uniref:Heme lyase NrfEFG subunit NrfE n=1 Tax=Conservatibacter flavescens TaxID=28161 RepID=A0A2M8S1X2_9PAST|nr:heme lyase NrfEFG subunit NrfE [Conservatibacter flavescens]PJG85150.1 heme lyase NrfEFG subunit NrfE [Conservatibacter flavescens]
MIPELGFIALLFATFSALLLSILPHIGIQKRATVWISSAWHFSYLLGIFTCISIACLAYAFAVDDFSVEYVAAHSNSQLPTFFKIAATWGGHEGSMLFWLFALSLWVMLFAWASRKIDPIIAARSLGILGLICLGFCLFILFLSNPFIRIFPHPLEGRDLNPMLQDVGLIFHPPLLYLGYVGFAVNLALTLAALLSGHLDAAIARWIRPWVLVSWLFLTLGIALGSWWAYYELGWGGWWFWDPVENASLMPWLLGLGLLHTLAATEQRGIFNYWTILFSIFAFAFSVLGTFIVRSGALTSVHAFAIDTSRGGALLFLFFILLVAALSIFAFKANIVSRKVHFTFLSKESLILLVNILFTVATASVFLGTFYPMLFTTLGWGSISVGPPYFNSIFMPLIVVVLCGMIIALVARWKKIDPLLLRKRLIFLVPALLLSGVIHYFVLKQGSTLRFHLVAFALLTLSLWVLIATLWCNWFKLNVKAWGMMLAHAGVAVTVIGAVMSSYYGSEIGVRLKPNESETLSGYEFRYLGFKNELGPNFTSEKAHFEIYKNQQFLTALFPERRHYDVRTMNMSEVGLQWGWFGDLYIVMGDKVGVSEFTFRLHYKPFVRWLWFGSLMMAIGALLAALGLRKVK